MAKKQASNSLSPTEITILTQRAAAAQTSEKILNAKRVLKRSDMSEIEINITYSSRFSSKEAERIGVTNEFQALFLEFLDKYNKVLIDLAKNETGSISKKSKSAGKRRATTTAR